MRYEIWDTRYEIQDTIKFNINSSVYALTIDLFYLLENRCKQNIWIWPVFTCVTLDWPISQCDTFTSLACIVELAIINIPKLLTILNITFGNVIKDLSSQSTNYI